MTIKAIETRYNGYRFRSRLEARWAVFFDALGIIYRYEPEGYDLGELGYYLPDFALKSTAHNTMIVEIKGTDPTDDEVKKLSAVCDSLPSRGRLFAGRPSVCTAYRYTLCDGVFHTIEVNIIDDEDNGLDTMLNLMHDALDARNAPRDWILTPEIDILYASRIATEARFEHGARLTPFKVRNQMLKRKDDLLFSIANDTYRETPMGSPMDMMF